jgi:hypothetical protein
MITLIDNLYIDADENQYILKLKTNSIDKKTGEPVYKTLGYYTKLSNAVNGALTKLSRAQVQQADVSLADALKQFRELENRLESLVEGVKE